MDRIKVLQFVGTGLKGGVESVVYTYSEALKDYVEPTFIFFDNSTNIPEEFIERIGGHYFIVPHVKHLGKFNKAFKKILNENKFDIIHSHINTFSTWVLFAAKISNIPVRIAHSRNWGMEKDWKMI